MKIDSVEMSGGKGISVQAAGVRASREFCSRWRLHCRGPCRIARDAVRVGDRLNRRGQLI
jgi:hypothetical protein